MRVLFVSGELISGDLAYLLKKEGCDLRMFIEDKGMKDCFDGLVGKINNWRNHLKWVGKKGLIIFDDVGYGKYQDELRKRGYLVIGGSSDGDNLELDRIYGQNIFKKYGIIGEDFETISFDINSAISFIEKNKGEWVIKQEGHNNALDYVGNLEDGSDVVFMLKNYKLNFGNSCRVTLQRKVSGVEIAIGRFFNGIDWIGPSIINFEHKYLFDGDIGPQGGESGTLMWFDDKEKNKLFQRTLGKIKSHLQRSSYKGYIDINCIVNKNKLYPLEFTCRFGSATIETQSEIISSPWHEFFNAMASGKNHYLKWNKGYCINVALTIPPFPYRTRDKHIIQKGSSVFFKKNITRDDLMHIHFEGVKLAKNKKTFQTAGNLGYTLYVTGVGKTIEEARKKVYRIINKIMIPKMFYRKDIGLRFVNKDKALLSKWGWI